MQYGRLTAGGLRRPVQRGWCRQPGAVWGDTRLSQLRSRLDNRTESLPYYSRCQDKGLHEMLDRADAALPYLTPTSILPSLLT
jgi:hypothetical protein